jgi:serine/threonine-protein kinase
MRVGKMPRQIKKVGKYDVIEMIARGGMGAVYKAKHPTLKRYVILKQLTLRGGAGFIQRFKREASLMFDFRNEHIVQVFDHFKEGASYYIAMEYVDGTSLDKLIFERGYLSIEASVLIFSGICKGLKYAHDLGVIHRDIKPANILISKEGEVKLVDFGIATSKEMGDDGLTKAGMTLGTPAYMSPEQISDTKNVDKRADIYSMGVVLYEMVTGEKPFPSSFTPEAISQINRGVYTRPQKFNPSIPGVLRKLIKKAMHHKASKRYRDLQHIVHILSRFIRKYRNQKAINRDIKKYLSGSDITLPSAFSIGKKMKGLAVAVLLGIVVAIVLCLGGLYFFYKGYYYEYFKNRDFGSIEIQASVPEGYYKDPEMIYAISRLTPVEPQTNEDQMLYDYRLVPEGSRLEDRIKQFFVKKEETSEKENFVLSSNTVYLPAGLYSLELYLENLKYYKIFYINPRVIQKQNVNTYEKLILQFDLRETSPKPVAIVPRVYDNETGESLYNVTDISFYLEEEDKWINWKKYIRDKRLQRYLLSKLMSGRSYTFKFESSSYYPETVRFFVESDLDFARAEAGLTKIPGKMIIKSDFEGLDLLIDNRSENYLGDKQKEFISYGKTSIEGRELTLPEGNYLLTVSKDKRHNENFQFTIRSKKTNRIRITYDTEEKKISIFQMD